MKNIQFPINFQFRIATISNDFIASDAQGHTVAYVRQKMFRLKEDILVYNDEEKSKVDYRIMADRWLDFSAAYTFYDWKEQELGKIVRKGWRSIWKAEYDLLDQNQNLQYTVREENAWTKVYDSIFGEIPILNFFTGYLFHPSYLVSDQQGNPIVRLKKMPSFFGRNFEVSKLGELDQDDTERIVLGLMMLILLERRRG
jgi:uncharacterized protein YxjI